MGDRHHALALQISVQIPEAGFIKDHGSPDEHFSFGQRSARVSQAAAQSDSFEIEASTCLCDGQFIEVGDSGT